MKIIFPTLFNFQTSFEFTESTLSFKDNTADKVFIIINYYSVLSYHSKHHLEWGQILILYSCLLFAVEKKRFNKCFWFFSWWWTRSRIAHTKKFFSSSRRLNFKKQKFWFIFLHFPRIWFNSIPSRNYTYHWSIHKTSGERVRWVLDVEHLTRYQ